MSVPRRRSIGCENTSPSVPVDEDRECGDPKLLDELWAAYLHAKEVSTLRSKEPTAAPRELVNEYDARRESMQRSIAQRILSTSEKISADSSAKQRALEELEKFLESIGAAGAQNELQSLEDKLRDELDAERVAECKQKQRESHHKS